MSLYNVWQAIERVIRHAFNRTSHGLLRFPNVRQVEGGKTFDLLRGPQCCTDRRIVLPNRRVTLGGTDSNAAWTQ